MIFPDGGITGGFDGSVLLLVMRGATTPSVTFGDSSLWEGAFWNGGVPQKPPSQREVAREAGRRESVHSPI